MPITLCNRHHKAKDGSWVSVTLKLQGTKPKSYHCCIQGSGRTRQDAHLVHIIRDSSVDVC